MHTFVATVLLRLSLFDSLRDDAKPYPPTGKMRYTTYTVRSKRHTIVRPDPTGQSIFSEQPLKRFLDRLQRGPRERMAVQKVSTLVIHNGQWIAPLPVAGEELPLKVGAPEIVGFVSRHAGFRLTRNTPTQLPFVDQSLAAEDIVDGRL